MTAREDAARSAAAALHDCITGSSITGSSLSVTASCDLCGPRAAAIVEAVVPPGHVVIPADPLAAVLDYILDGQGDFTDAMAAAQRLATALDAWTVQP